MAPDANPEAAAAPPQLQVDEGYEFCAPKFFDFVCDETEEEIRAAERWFEASASHAPSRTLPNPHPAASIIPPSPVFCFFCAD
jgi:targeting protein for Xklp2